VAEKGNFAHCGAKKESMRHLFGTCSALTSPFQASSPLPLQT